jgi:multidrug efflux pump subunit AcrA (membrane-fusion protein)
VITAGIVAVVVIAIGQLGTSTSSARTERQVVTATNGVVQSSVTGTGSLEPVTEEDVDFQTSGTLAHVDVKEGEYVHKGQLLATLDDTTAALTLKQAKATLAEARTTLSSDETSLGDSTDTSNTVEEGTAEDVSYTPTTSTTTAPTTSTVTQTVTAPTSQTTTETTPAATTPTRTTTQSATTETATSTTAAQPTQTTTTTGSSGGSTSSASSSSSSSSTVTASTVDADKLQVVEDEQTVKEDRQALTETRLRAPVSGTITSLDSIVAGDSVSSGSDSSASDASSSSSSTSGASTAASGSTTGSTSSSTASSSSFAVIDTLRHLSMTVSFTEADINKIKVGQTAVVTLDALSNLELAGKVTEVSSLGTTTDDVTSYDATVTLDQYDARVKPGMSASAEVVIKQGHGVTVPSGAVTGSGTLATVTEDVNGKQTTKKVIVGIRGDSRDLIVSGLTAGAELVETETLPSTGSSTSSSSSSSSSATSGFSRRLSGGFGGGFSGGGSGGFSGPPSGGGGVP